MKKTLALILCLILSMQHNPFIIRAADSITSPPAYQNSYFTSTQYADYLNALNLIKGSNKGYELDRTPTRLEALVLVIRLLGKESEALSSYATDSHFSDVPDWGIPYTNYAYAMKITTGINNEQFAPERLVGFSDFLSFLLRVLGYSEAQGDFTSTTLIDRSVALGLIENKAETQKNFTRADLVRLSYQALSIRLKNSASSLIDYLIQHLDLSTLTGKKNLIVDQYKLNTESDYTQAILRAHQQLKSVGGGNLIFLNEEYKIRPKKIYIPTQVNWLGIKNATLYSQESSGYNVLVSTEPGAKNIQIKNLVFDQRLDSEITPNINGSGGSFLLHINNTNDVTIKACTFFTYGVCAVLAQSDDTSPTININVSNNTAYFERKVATFYDVSVFNIDGKNVTFENNVVEATSADQPSYWKPRSAFELHMPSGKVSNNIAKNTEVGILHVSWPMLWKTYDPNYDGQVTITNNTIDGAIVGISIWGASTLPNIISENITIKDNRISLGLDSQYIPSQGISLVDGDIGNSYFRNITIDNNTITMPIDSSNESYLMGINRKVPGNVTGAILCNTTNIIENLSIINNKVNQFPFAFLNLNIKNASDQKVHNTIRVISNTIADSQYSLTYDFTYQALFNIGNTNDIIIKNNILQNTKYRYLHLLNTLEHVSQSDIQLE